MKRKEKEGRDEKEREREENERLHINYMHQGERSANCRKVERLDK